MDTQIETGEKATRRMRRHHPALADIAKFREGVAAMSQPEEEVKIEDFTPTVSGVGPSVSTSTSVPVPIPTPAPASPSTSAPTYAPVENIKLPEGYQDVLNGVSTAPRKMEPSVSAVDTGEEHYKAQNEALMKELEALKQELAEAKKLPDELRQLQEERDLDKLLQESTPELGSIDIDDAKKLLSPILRTVRAQMAQSSQQAVRRVQDVEKELHSQMERLREQEQRQQLARVRDIVLKAHPDLEQLQKTPEYQQVMMQPVGGGSGLLVGQLVAAEYQQGNTDYVINVLNQIKTRANKNNVPEVSVSPSSVPSGPVVDAPKQNDRLTLAQLEEYKTLVQLGKISRNEFRDIMKKHRAAAKS